jgi:hypothetical protein
MTCSAVVGKQSKQLLGAMFTPPFGLESPACLLGLTSRCERIQQSIRNVDNAIPLPNQACYLWVTFSFARKHPSSYFGTKIYLGLECGTQHGPSRGNFPAFVRARSEAKASCASPAAPVLRVHRATALARAQKSAPTSDCATQRYKSSHPAAPRPQVGPQHTRPQPSAPCRLPKAPLTLPRFHALSRSRRPNGRHQDQSDNTA